LLAALNVSQYLLALIGCWIGLRSGRHRSVVLFFLLLTAYFTLTSGVSAEPRYKMPVTPLYLLLAGIAVQAWVNRRAR
jgi:peptidoglycan/LPS O-acetylase OafA/YrhL